MACVVVVDDQPLILRSVARALRAAGHEVRTASRRDELAQIDCSGVDLIVMDIDLGHDDGIALAAEMAARGEHAPIMFHTANADRDTLTRATRLGGVLPKGDLEPLYRWLEREGERPGRYASGVVRKVDASRTG